MELNKSFPCFPIPVTISNFGKDSHEMNVRLVNDILDEADYINKDGLVQSNLGGWHSDNMLHHGSFKMLQQHVEQCLNNYCEIHGYWGGLIVDHFWANINRSNDYNLMHHHGLSAMTGVYYPVKCIKDNQFIFNYKDQVSLDSGMGNYKDEGGALIFQDPNFGLKTHLTWKDHSPFNISHYHFYPVSGVLLLFPTYLLHTVTPMYTEEYERMSISFSCKYPEDSPKKNYNGNY